MAVHSGERRHLCAECGRAFIHQSNMVSKYRNEKKCLIGFKNAP